MNVLYRSLNSLFWLNFRSITISWAVPDVKLDPKPTRSFENGSDRMLLLHSLQNASHIVLLRYRNLLFRLLQIPKISSYSCRYPTYEKMSRRISIEPQQLKLVSASCNPFNSFQSISSNSDTGSIDVILEQLVNSHSMRV